MNYADPENTGLLCIGVKKLFPGNRGICKLSMKIAPGISYALIGANGAGKTTLINLCLNFLHPDEGEIWIGGFEVTREPVQAMSALAYVPEISKLYGNFSAIENLMFFENLMGRSHPESYFKDILNHLDFPVIVSNTPLKTYSKGMRQKVSLAIGLAKGAKVFLLDEPTSGLDPRSSRELGLTIRRLSQEGKAILFTTHHLDNIQQSADRVGILHAGSMVFEGDAETFTEVDMAKMYEIIGDEDANQAI